MKLLDEIREEGFDRVKRLVEDQHPESQIVEFKRTLEVKDNRLSSKGRKDLSTQFSGMANGAGGVIIYGIDTKKKDGIDVADKLVPIINLERYKNLITAAVPEIISPDIVDVEILAVFNSKSKTNGFIVASIPQSDDRPHMATAKNEHRFYRRGLERTSIMDRAQVRDMFLAQRSAILQHIVEPSFSSNYNNCVAVKLRFSLDNIGRVMAKNPFIRIEYPFPLNSMIASNLECRQRDLEVTYSLLRNPTVHPGELKPFISPEIYFYPVTSEFINLYNSGNRQPWTDEKSWTIGVSTTHPDTSGKKSISVKQMEFKIAFGAENSPQKTQNSTVTTETLIDSLSKRGELFENFGRSFLQRLY